MSVSEAAVGPTREAPARERPRLRSVPGSPRRLASLPFAAVIVAIVVSGMVGLLTLNTAVQDQAFQLRNAQRNAAKLELQASDLQAQVYRKAAPGELASAATALGMVPNVHPVFIDLRSGQIIGNPQPAAAGDIPALAVRPAPSASASPEAASPQPTTSQKP